MRLMGLDYGSKTVGVAISDPLQTIAQPLVTIPRKEENKLRKTLAAITELARQYEVSLIVIGLPAHMDESLGERARLTMAFGEQVARRTGLPVCYEDERLTTVEADEVLAESGVPKGERKRVIDQVAASLILKQFINRQDTGYERGSDHLNG